MSKKIANQLVDMLIDSGVKRIYAVAGDSINQLNDAVRQNSKIKWIHVRHEEAGAYAASAEAQLKGLACCAGSSGPGHVHLINGLYDAHRSGAPVFAIASTIPTIQYGSGFFQETNVTKLFDDCSHYNQTATTPEQFPRMFQSAIQHSLYKKGVSVLGLPSDLISMKAVTNISSDKNYFPKAVIHPNVDEINSLAKLINENKKICIFCGIGASSAHDEIVEMSKILKAPVGYSFRGKMGIQYDNPNEVGMTGLLGLPSAYSSMEESDLILLLGTDFPYTNFIPQNKVIIQIDTAPERLGRRAKLTLGLQGDIKDTLEILIPLLNAKKDDAFLKKQLHTYEKVKKHLNTHVKDLGKRDAIYPEAVAFELNKLAEDNAIFTVDTGMCCVWGARYIHSTGKRDLLGSFVHGSMANALPHAIGAALACPERQVVAMCGDGGISMTLGELATIKQYNLPIKIIVFNNRSLGMVKLEMEVAGLKDSETDMINPDFALTAESFGIKGITINEPKSLISSFKEAFEYDGPILVNVMTDANSFAMPPKVEIKMVKGMAVSMLKKLASGEVGEVIKTVQSNYKHLEELGD